MARRERAGAFQDRERSAQCGVAVQVAGACGGAPCARCATTGSLSRGRAPPSVQLQPARFLFIALFLSNLFSSLLSFCPFVLPLSLSSPHSVQNRALSAIAQAESLKFKLLGGLAVRRACYGVMRYVMENGAKGVEVVISGKLRAARAKAMKFRDGYMVKSGDAVNHYIDFAVRHIQLKQGVLGIKVKIQLPHDPTGKNGVAVKPSDVVTILDPKEELPVTQPKQQGFVQNVETAAAPAVAAETQQ